MISNTILGRTVISKNTAFHSTAMSIRYSNVEFHGTLEVERNRGTNGGAVYVLMSTVSFNRIIANFSNNHAANGGATTLDLSVLYISSNATVEFNRNKAQDLGGAIYIYRPRITYYTRFKFAPCSIRVQSKANDSYSITFNQNKEGIAGNAIYGGWTLACMPGNEEDSLCTSAVNVSLPPLNIYNYNGFGGSDLSNFTSDPTRVCFCEKGIPNSYRVLNNITVHPGEHFTLSLAIVGYGLGTVPGSVIARGSGDRRSVEGQSLFGSELEEVQEIRGTQCQDVGYSIVSDRDREQIALAVETQSFVIGLKEVQAVHNYMLGYVYNDVPFLSLPV